MQLIGISHDRKTGVVSMGGSTLEVGLDLVPKARSGDYILVHAGIALEVMEEKDAGEILEIFRQYTRMHEQVEPEADGPND